MQIVRTPSSARAIARTLIRPVGFVPTMGALHRGHDALVARAREENASVVASIFVNPLQFGPGEDYERYPRAFDADCERFERAGVDVLYAPTADRMYPSTFATSVDAGPIARSFEGARRPGHFTGVATVIVKLLHAIEPTSLYLGQKDVQQTAVLRTVLRDLDLATHIVVVPTVREADGLALSSRNRYLSDEARRAAPSFAHALQTAAQELYAEGATLESVLEQARGRLEPPLRWEYLALVDPERFEVLTSTIRPAVLIGVVLADSTRLLDNVTIAAVDGSDPIVSAPRPRASVLAPKSS